MGFERVNGGTVVIVPDGQSVRVTEKQKEKLPLLETLTPNYWELGQWDRQSFDSMWKKGLIRYRSPTVEERFIVKTIHLTTFGKQVLEELRKEESEDR